MPAKLISLTIALALAGTGSWAQAGAGAKFGARDPRTCASIKAPAKGAPTGDQLRQVFICQEEGISNSAAGGETLNLLTDVKIEVGKARPFNMNTDAWPDSDPSQPIYPVRGGYTNWTCGEIGYMGYVKGHNCTSVLQPHASGICYKNSYGDWVCKLLDINATPKNACPGAGGATECLLPPPGEQ